MAALAAGTLGATSVLAEDLEILDPQIAMAFAQVLTEEAEGDEKAPVKIEGDIEAATGVHRENIGLILVPQKDLKPEEIPEAVNADPGAPMAHLFMSYGFAPVVDGEPLDKSKMKTLTMTGQDGTEQKVSYLALTARHTDDDVWHLYGYGTDEKPVLDVQIGEGIGPGTMPLALEVKDVEEDTGTAYVTIYDRFQTAFKVNYKADEDSEEAGN
ncbi:MAG: hypothetical protein DWQ37_07740 [Planctomycetota bacterium]|nr:MAG: hypothetical protein DWQ37_07740 [Planctomycetota bacterium]